MIVETATEDLEDWPGACACCGIWTTELAAGVVEVAAEELEDLSGADIVAQINSLSQFNKSHA